MEISSSHLPATKQTWRKVTTIREIFTQIADSNPRGSESAWRKAFFEEIRNNPESFDAAAQYAFDACLRAYEAIKTHEQTKRSVTAIRRREAEAEEVTVTGAEIKDRVILLNMEMPNGKRARYCTLDYFYRLGGSYRRIGKKGDSTLIGSKYNEAQLRSGLKGLR